MHASLRISFTASRADSRQPTDRMARRKIERAISSLIGKAPPFRRPPQAHAGTNGASSQALRGLSAERYGVQRPSASKVCNAGLASARGNNAIGADKVGARDLDQF